MQSTDSDSDSAARDAVQFASTHWSTVLAAGDSTSPDSQEALERLCRTYWYPLYAFVRRKGYSPADAQDLTQGFFERFSREALPPSDRPGTRPFSHLPAGLSDAFPRRRAGPRSSAQTRGWPGPTHA